MRLIVKEIKTKQKNKVSSSQQTRERFSELFDQKNENSWARDFLYGIENNTDLGTSSKVNMLLHGDGSANIFVKDGLFPFQYYEKPNTQLDSNRTNEVYEKSVNESFDVVVSNPPFSVKIAPETKKQLIDGFVFGKKKSSENLFIERYYQLLKEEGRLGVILPESVFDTKSFSYIRLFLYQYFNIKAIISLPETTFKPYTTTKTNILIAQKKKNEEVLIWNQSWDKASQRFTDIKRFVRGCYRYFFENKNLNRRNSKWTHELPDQQNKIPATPAKNDFLEETITVENRSYIKTRMFDFFRNHINVSIDDTLTIKELFFKYLEEYQYLIKNDSNNHKFDSNSSQWIFQEVVKELYSSIPIHLFHTENLGYNRTSRGVSITKNDLFRVEIAPYSINLKSINEFYDKKIDNANSDDLSNNFKNEKNQKIQFLKRFYDESGTLKNEYKDRTNRELLDEFQNSHLKHFKSEDILLEKEDQTILGFLRKNILWD